LVAHGVDSTRLFTAGCGERMPIADNSTSDGRAINRRIEFSIYDGVSSGCPQVEAIPTFSNTQEKEIAQSLQKGENLSFTNIRFKTNSDEITEPSKEILDNVVNVLKKLSELKLSIEGHTDSDGSEAHNQDLSERRAYSVKVYLVQNGVDALRLKTSGFGESQPIASNDTAEGKAKNRRIEFKKFD
jgi:outer membrane protein OmpA-like peptidoglycan-associated protein